MRKTVGKSLRSTRGKLELANRLFFRLYQCANMLHKTGSRAVESEGLTTQQWAVLGALSRPESKGGMSVNDLARYKCFYRTARLAYSATLITNPEPPKKPAKPAAR